VRLVISRRTRRAAVWGIAATVACSAQAALTAYMRWHMSTIGLLSCIFKRKKELSNDTATTKQLAVYSLCKVCQGHISVPHSGAQMRLCKPPSIQLTQAEAGFRHSIERCSFSRIILPKGFTCLRFLHTAELVPK
jgi:hypothetical protein